MDDSSINRELVQKHIRRQKRKLEKGQSVELSPFVVKKDKTSTVQTRKEPTYKQTLPIDIERQISHTKDYRPKTRKRVTFRESPVSTRSMRLTKRRYPTRSILKTTRIPENYKQHSYLVEIYKNMIKNPNNPPRRISRYKYYDDNNEETKKRIKIYTKIIDLMNRKTQDVCKPKDILNPTYLYAYLRIYYKKLVNKESKSFHIMNNEINRYLISNDFISRTNYCLSYNTDEGKLVFGITEYLRQHGKRPDTINNKVYNFVSGKYIDENSEQGKIINICYELYKIIYHMYLKIVNYNRKNRKK